MVPLCLPDRGIVRIRLVNPQECRVIYTNSMVIGHPNTQPFPFFLFFVWQLPTQNGQSIFHRRAWQQRDRLEVGKLAATLVPRAMFGGSLRVRSWSFSSPTERPRGREVSLGTQNGSHVTRLVGEARAICMWFHCLVVEDHQVIQQSRGS